MTGIEPWPTPLHELRDALERVRLDLLHREAVLDHAATTSGLEVRHALPVVFLHDNAEPHRVPRAPVIAEALAAHEAHLQARRAVTDPEVARLGGLARELGLDRMEEALLLTAIAPQFSTGFMQAFDRLVPGCDRGRVPLPLLADLVATGDPERWYALAALRPDGRLRTTGLLVAEGPTSAGYARADAQTTLAASPVALDYLMAAPASGRPFALQGLARRVECERQLDALALGPEELLALTRLAGHEGRDDRGRLRVGALTTGGRSARVLAEALAAEAGRDLLVLEGLVEGSSQAALHAYRQIALYARLHQLALLVEVDDAPEAALAFFCEAIAECPQVLLCSRHPLRALERLGDVALMAVELPPITARERAWCWRDAFGAGADIEALAATFALDAAEIAALGASATHRREAARLARLQLAIPLEGVGERLETRLTLDDLVLPNEVRARLDEIATFLIHGQRVERALGARGRPMTAIFYGPSGTGKTAAATALARAVERPIIEIDAASVVDRYLPDIERRLERLYDRATRDEAILLFEDVDALFGKRGDNAQDRFANVQVNLLLQRMEAYQGLTIVTVGAIETVDPAFRRRAQFQVQLPRPGTEARQRLWRSALSEVGVEVAEELVSELASTLELSGGAIRKAVMTASVLASSQGLARLDETTLREAARRESRSVATPAPAPGRAFGL